MKDHLKDIAIEIIKMHGFGSNTKTGFSCTIADIKPFSNKEGLLLWVYSTYRNRFETKFEHFKKPQRIKRMKEMLNLQSSDYKSQIENVINKYAESLLKINGFSKIGEGIIFENSTIFNLACSFNFIKNNPNSLLEFEEFTINNPIVEYCEKNNYFECKKKNEFFAKNKKYL
jgi:hypothetical protein